MRRTMYGRHPTRATPLAHIHDEGQLGAIEEVQFFQLPVIKEFLKSGWRRRLAGGAPRCQQPFSLFFYDDSRNSTAWC